MAARPKKCSFPFVNEKTPVDDAFDFAKHVCRIGSSPPPEAYSALYFRGHADAKWHLEPGIARPRSFWGTKTLDKKQMLATEYAFLHRFRRYAHAFLKREVNRWEAITMAQHHGLPTRLLDWTSNPLVALYFATEDHMNADGVVFSMRLRKVGKHINVYDDGSRAHPHRADPLKVQGIKIVYPMMSTNRLVTQSGAFTIQDPSTPLDKVANRQFNDEDLDVFDITRWTIPARGKPQILSQLERVGINRRTLFPDLDGVAAGLLRAEMLKDERHQAAWAVGP